MSAQKWKQIERNLAEQESFVQSIIEQREKKTTNTITNNKPIHSSSETITDTLLSSSIQRAKDKISFIDSNNNISTQNNRPPRHDRSFDGNTSRDSRDRERKGEEGSAIAAAMKKLQERINSLEQDNRRLENDNKDVKESKKKINEKYEDLLQQLQQTKRKAKNLEHSVQKDKQYIKELEKKVQSLEKQIINSKVSNNSGELQSKLSTSEMMFRAQEQQFRAVITDNQNKQRKIMEMENMYKQNQLRINQELSVVKSLNREIQIKMAVLEQKLKQKDQKIEQLTNQLSKKQNFGTKVLKSHIENQQEYQNQTQNFETKASRKKLLNQQIINDQELEQIRQKYEELFITYKALDQKSRNDKNQIKNYRTKFWQLKQAVKELIQKIQTLPNGVTSQLRYLIVKVNKIEVFSNDYFAATPSKSNRKVSILNSTSRSKSKSQSKKKDIKVDLNRSNNSVKSKRSTHTNRSTQSKKQKSKQKQVIISQKAIKKSEVLELESQIQQIRRRYKQLAVGQAKGNEVSQDVRQQLNNLAVLLQQKSEQLTLAKRKK